MLLMIEINILTGFFTGGSMPKAVFDTNMGSFTIELFADKAPKTVENFVKLSNEGFYNGVIFHRVIEDFMIQSGDPEGTGRGGPGYTIEDEFHEDLKHDSAGILSMANTGMPNSGGSQFFITYDATPWLDGRHAVFGRVTEGIDVLESLTARDPSTNPGFKGDAILSILIQEE